MPWSHREGPVNEGLKGVLPKNYARPALNKTMLGELIDLILQHRHA
jgi:type I restriction enzyme M protein